MTTSGDPTGGFARPRLPAGARNHSNIPVKNHNVYQIKRSSDFRLQEFAKADNLYSNYRHLVNHGGHGAGTDGFGPSEFSRHELFPALRGVVKSLINRTYKPYPVRKANIRKANGGVRTLSIQRYMDRVVTKALHNCLAPFWRKRFSMFSIWQIYARLDREIRSRGWFILATDDIRDCFPTANLNQVMHWHRVHIQNESLLNLIETVIRGHEGSVKLTGLDQGSPYSPVAMELVLHHILDSEIDAHLGNTTPFRYVDNLTYLCSDVCEATRILDLAEYYVVQAGFQLKKEDGEPQDLRDQGSTRKVLGLIPRWSNGQLAFSIPETAYENLMQYLRLANEATHPSAYAEMCCQGWLRSLAPALTTSVELQVVDRITELARHEGFRNITCGKLLVVTRSAREQWHRLRSQSR